MRSIRTSTALWPIVVVTFDDKFANADLVYTIHEHTQLLRRGRYFCTIRDLRAMKSMPSAVQRRIGTDWQDDVGPDLHQWCLGVANLSTSGFVRSLMTAISWVSPPPTPETLCSDWESAFAWCVERLDEKGIAPPEGMQAYLDRQRLAAS